MFSIFVVAELDLKSSSLQICHKEYEKSQTRRKGFTTRDFRRYEEFLQFSNKRTNNQIKIWESYDNY